MIFLTIIHEFSIDGIKKIKKDIVLFNYTLFQTN